MATCTNILRINSGIVGDVNFLLTLQVHQKWLHPCRVIKNGDIVLVKDENLSCNLWQLARVYGTHNEEDGLVRKVRVAVGDKKLCGDGTRTSAATYLERPDQKLVVLLNLRTI